MLTSQNSKPQSGPTGLVRWHMGGSEGQGSRRTRPERQKLALGTWNVTSLWGKEPELVREVELPVRSGGAYLYAVSALVPYSWIGVGLYSSPELPRGA